MKRRGIKDEHKIKEENNVFHDRIVDGPGIGPLRIELGQNELIRSMSNMNNVS